MRLLALFLLLVAAVVVFAAFCVGILDQRQIAFRTLIQQVDPTPDLLREWFGEDFTLNEPIIDQPGLYLRIPGVHQVRVYDSRLLRLDARPQNAYTANNDLILLDYYVLWRIEDPRRFYEAFPRDTWIQDARNRIDNTTYSKLRNELARHQIQALLSEDREEIVSKATSESADEVRRQGIRIVDMRISGLAYPDQNVPEVYRRMRSERQRFALRARARGEEEARAIRSQADETALVTLAEAEREAERLRGEGDAEAAGIYAEAFNKDPEFYAFTRSLEAYRKALDEQTTLILSPQVPFLQHLFRMPPASQLPPVSAPAPTP